MQSVQEKFLRKAGDSSDSVRRQIISLGCGYDTFVFNLFSQKEQFAHFSYFEVDLPEVAEKKVGSSDPGAGDREEQQDQRSLRRSAPVFRQLSAGEGRPLRAGLLRPDGPEELRREAVEDGRGLQVAASNPACRRWSFRSA